MYGQTRVQKRNSSYFYRVIFPSTRVSNKVLLEITMASRKTGKQFFGKYLHFQKGILARTRNPFPRNYCPSFGLSFFFHFLISIAAFEWVRLRNLTDRINLMFNHTIKWLLRNAYRTRCRFHTPVLFLRFSITFAYEFAPTFIRKTYEKRLTLGQQRARDRPVFIISRIGGLRLSEPQWCTKSCNK